MITNSLKFYMFMILDYSFSALLSPSLTTIRNVRFDTIHYIIVGPTGDLIVTDSHAIWHVSIKVSPPTKDLIAGSLTRGYREGTGVQAQFRKPKCAMLMNETHLLVSDRNNHCLRTVDLQSNTTSRYAGDCTSEGYTEGGRLDAQFENPVGLLILGENTYIADSWNHAIRVLQLDNVTTLFSGSPLVTPEYLAACSYDVIYATIQHGIVRMELSSLDIEQIAGSTTYYGFFDGFNGDLRSSQFHNPAGIIHLSKYLLAVADVNNGRVRTIDLLVNETGTLQCESDNGTTSACVFGNPTNVRIYEDQLLLGDGIDVKSIPLYSIIEEQSDNRECLNSSLRTVTSTTRVASTASTTRVASTASATRVASTASTTRVASTAPTLPTIPTSTPNSGMSQAAITKRWSMLAYPVTLQAVFVLSQFT